MEFLKRLASSRIVRLLVVAGGSWRFWAASAFAATAAATIVAYVYVLGGSDASDVGSCVYYDLVGPRQSSSSNSNATDRVLLMNADRNAKCFVDCENLNGSTSSSKTACNWWELVNSDATKLTGDSYPYASMQKGTHFKLHAKGADGKVLWEMINCRAGNLNKKANTYVNRLPFVNTGTAMRYNTRGSKATAMSQAGTLIMLNTDEAEVLSSCYDEGIGTIYFDAVNAYKGYTSGELAVEVAYGVFKTNVTGQVVSRNVPDDLEVASTNADGSVVYVRPEGDVCDEIRKVDEIGLWETNKGARVAWVRAKMSGCYFTASGHENIGTNDVLKLQCTVGNSDKNFYRVWAAVQDRGMNPELAEHCHRPMRFRIRRLDNPPDVTGYSYGDLDGSGLSTVFRSANGLLILDNIIASFPAMTAAAHPKGTYVEGGSSRNEIGWRDSTTVSFPSVKDAAGLHGQASLVAVTNAPPDESVTDAWQAGTTAAMKYRWRYVGQTRDWQSSAMAMTGGDLVTADPLTLPSMEGDVEYYYETTLDAPYYGYVDYSGGNYGTPGYSERVKVVRTSLSPEGIPGAGLPSGGTNFFFRLRAGRSDQQEYRLQLRSVKTLEEREETFYLTGDGVWKTFVLVTSNASNTNLCQVGDYDFRIVAVSPEGYYGGATVTQVPWSGKRLTEDATSGGSNAWTRVTLDASTGAFMFQLVEVAASSTSGDSASGGSLTYTVTHADYQDFNAWTDAVSTKTPPLYIGAYTQEKGRQSGSSPDTRTFPSELDSWMVTAASNQVYWTENFDIGKDRLPSEGWDGHEAYEAFSESATPNGWRAYNGQWVCGKYRESAKGGSMTLSLDSAGKGVLEYVNTAEMPQGVDEFTVSARVSQSAKFENFMYYSNAGVEDMTNYLFSARVTMGTSTDTFDGNGAVSLVGYYRPGEGCYEVRAERVADDIVKLSLYKWMLDEESDQVEPVFIAEHCCQPKKNKDGTLQSSPRLAFKAATSTSKEIRPTNLLCNEDLSGATTPTDAKFGELFIRCTTRDDGTTLVEAGLLTDADNSSGKSDPSGKLHTYFQYTDHDNPFGYGYFGYASMNCPARFFGARWYLGEKGASFPTLSNTDSKNQNAARGSGITGLCATNPLCATAKAITYPTEYDDAFLTSPSDKKRYKNWSNKPNRFLVWNEAGSDCYRISEKRAVVAVKPVGSLDLYLDEGSSTRLVGSHSFSNFVYETCTFQVRSTTQARPRLKTSAKSAADIVISGAQFNQWSSGSYSDTDDTWFSGSKMRQSWGCPEHYVYLNGWVSSKTVGAKTEKCVTLAPARVRTGEIASIRAPLMDGLDDNYGARGLGLGVFSYTYRDADPRCRILVQYRELSGATGVRNATSSEDGWTTVATNDFSKLSAAELASGTMATYFGLHGTKGMMRILVDPAVVTAAQNEKTNPGKDPEYGSIVITSFVSRDAPPLDDRCWMGWNMRTTDDADERSLSDSNPSDAGLALGLNNSATKDVEKTYYDKTTGETVEYGDLFDQELPYVQTPTFATNIVGEVGFRARRLPGATNATQVAIFGAKSSADTSTNAWTYLRTYLVTNDIYETYTYRAGEGDDYAAFRLAVIGVAEVSPNYGTEMLVRPAQRVLIDDVYVSEAIRGQVAFRGVAAFRKGLDDSDVVKNAESREQQPLTQESWGVQCEVYVSQMEEEIDMTRTPEVYLHWYAGEEPWGYANWRDSQDAHVAKLAQAGDTTNWVFRSSYLTCPEAVIDPISTNSVVQYTLEVRYWAAGSDATTKPLTNRLSSAEWDVPSWYHPIDLNAGKSFSAYTILDSVAPGWAWINEVNIFGTYDKLWQNSDKARQYVEVAMPADADLSEWTLRFLGVDDLNSGKVTTNVVARFGHNVGAGTIPGTKDKNVGSNCVFLVVAGLPAQAAGTLDASQGEVDGYWMFDHTSDIFQQKGTIRENRAFAIQLVRPSGIVEHEVVAVGTNRYAGTLYTDNTPEKYVEFFNKLEKGGQFFYIGDELGGDANSIGSVASEVTSSASDWSYAMARTPGRINEGQYINPEHPIPSGDSVHVYFSVGDHVWQTVEGVKTNVTKIVVVRKGDPDGLEVVYDVDRWHVLDGVTTNDVAATPVQETTHRYRLTVAKACSNSMVTVVANARENTELLSQYGVTADNWYHDAIMNWLSAGKDVYGREWKDDGEDIKLARYEDMSGTFSTNMTLTSMYWLDIPPTEGGWVLRGGIGSPAQIDDPGNAKTNIRVKVYMMISNENEVASWADTEPHRLAHAPYVLRGAQPGESSCGLDPTVAGSPAWTSVTFKVTSFMLNGLTDSSDREQYIPLRLFVFNENSFNPRGHTDGTTGELDEFWATIDVRHPFTPASPAYYSSGYRDWLLNHDGVWPMLIYRWDLDDRTNLFTVEPLKADSTFKTADSESEGN